MAEPNELAAKILQAIREGRASRPARLAAARGALPIPVGDMVLLQTLLAQESDEEIAAAAQESLGALSVEDTGRLAADGDTPLEVLAFLAANPDRWPTAAAFLAGSPRVPAGALRPIARSTVIPALEMLATNHHALSADPELGPILAENPALPPASRGRLFDFLDELAKKAPAPPLPAPSTPAAPEEAVVEITTAPPAQDPFLAALGVDAELEALLPELGIDIGLLQERSELLGEAENADEASLMARLAAMTVGQKLKVALFGGRSERALLIRDSNRLVAAGVVKNPKFTANEAETAANSRNVNEEVLRLVARHRDFSQLYTVQHNLVRNPRTPMEIALNLVALIHEKDLRLLLRNRNIPDAIRRQAKKIIEIRESRRQIRVGPKKG